MAYLDERSRNVLLQIVDNPTITGKQLQDMLDLSRKQLSYSLEKVNDYLMDNGFECIERLKTGKFQIPAPVIDEYKTENFNLEEADYTYSDKERQYLIVLLLLCRQEELSTADFTYELNISKNTFLLDLKKLQQTLCRNYKVDVHYSRKDGYRMTGSEFAKRESLITAIRKVLLMPNGACVIKKICNIEEAEFASVYESIMLIEDKLNIKFTDERLEELPFILYLILRRIKQGKLLDAIAESFQHIVGTSEYTATNILVQKYAVENQLERMFIAAQIQSSNVSSMRNDDVEVEKQITDAAFDMIERFEEISLVQIQGKSALLEALVQHCKPAYYRMKYKFHIENSAIDMVLPQHAQLHEMVRRASQPFAALVGSEIVDDELVYLTVLFGAWLKKEGNLEIIEEKKKAIVICSNGVTVSNYLYVTLSELLPEIEFKDCLSIRAFEEYDKPYDLIFTTVRLDSEKPQYLVKPFLNDYAKQRFREKVMGSLSGIKPHRINLSEIMDIVRKHAQVDDNEQMMKDLQQYLFQDPSLPTQKVVHQEGVELSLADILTTKTVQVEHEELSWQQAIEKAAKPLLDQGDIESRYVKKMIDSIEQDKPYIAIADGVIVAHAGIDDGVNEVAMGLLRLPKRIPIFDYLEADMIVVLATPDRTKHLNPLFQFIEITENETKMKALRQASDVDQMLNILIK